MFKIKGDWVRHSQETWKSQSTFDRIKQISQYVIGELTET